MRNFTVQFVQWPIETEEMKTHDQIAEAILKGEINTDLLISHVLPVEKFQEGFDAGIIVSDDNKVDTVIICDLYTVIWGDYEE